MKHPFEFGERVNIDGDDTITAVVLAFAYRPAGEIEAQVSWWSGGSLNEQWLGVSRLAKAED